MTAFGMPPGVVSTGDNEIPVCVTVCVLPPMITVPVRDSFEGLPSGIIRNCVASGAGGSTLNQGMDSIAIHGAVALTDKSYGGLSEEMVTFSPRVHSARVSFTVARLLLPPKGSVAT